MQQQPHMPPSQQQSRHFISQQQTIPHPAVSPPASNNSTPRGAFSQNRQNIKKISILLLLLFLGVVTYFIWKPASSPSSSSISQQNIGFSSTSTTFKSSNGNTTTSLTGNIQVYVVGAVHHPGVYDLPSNARVYQLLQAAGGPLPDANLVALNLAARLNDGQEVYVTRIGEQPPTYTGGVPGPGTSTGDSSSASGQLININTASADELRQGLHVSSTTAQNIVNYRQQHGNYTSIDQLLQVVSKSIYDKIKGMVTV